MRPHDHLRRQNDTRGGSHGVDEGLAMGWLFAYHARLLDVWPGCLERPVDVYGYGALAWNGEDIFFDRHGSTVFSFHRPLRVSFLRHGDGAAQQNLWHSLGAGAGVCSFSLATNFLFVDLHILARSSLCTVSKYHDSFVQMTIRLLFTSCQMPTTPPQTVSPPAPFPPKSLLLAGQCTRPGGTCPPPAPHPSSSPQTPPESVPGCRPRCWQ